MARVTVEDCIDKVENRFELVLLASHRARMVSSGAQITIDRDNAMRLGLTLSAIDNTLYDAFGQRQVSTIYNAMNQYHVVMEVEPRYWQDPTTLSQLYLAFILMSLGWVGMGTVVTATVVSSWFERRRGLAISLAFTGASFGGVVVTPVLLILIERLGFQAAMLASTAIILAVLVPVAVGWIGSPPAAVLVHRLEHIVGDTSLQAPAIQRGDGAAKLVARDPSRFPRRKVEGLVSPGIGRLSRPSQQTDRATVGRESQVKRRAPLPFQLQRSIVQ